jgi:GDP-D-mannose dehydratase
MHFLITGHTGFKGAWLSLILLERGHLVSGISLQPEVGSLFERAEIGKFLENDIRCDIRESAKLQSQFKEVNPDVVIHLAAQALVRESYKNPSKLRQSMQNLRQQPLSHVYVPGLIRSTAHLLKNCSTITRRVRAAKASAEGCNYV